MNGKDPAAARFAVIQAVRLSGVGLVVAGMLVAYGRFALPDLAGYALLAVGLIHVFIIPPILVRKWRTPK